MEEEENSLEKKSKEFLKLIIENDPKNFGFNPIEVKDLYKYTPLINYLLKKNYLIEGNTHLEKEITVKSLRYKFTSEGKNWALK